MKSYEPIALERYSILFRMAKLYPDKAKRYVYLARKLSEKSGVTIPRDFKRSICKSCNAFLIPGKNCTVRLKNKVRYVTCKECGNIKRFIYAGK